MSYNIIISTLPIPEDDEAAWEYIDARLEQEHETELPAHPAYLDLIRKLTAIYPCICDLETEDIDDGVWSDGPLLLNAGHAATVLGLVYSAVDEALPVIIQIALRNNLAVLDAQSGRIYRPAAVD